MVARAILRGQQILLPELFSHKANEIPARNKNREQGSSPSCEYMKNLLWRALGLSQDRSNGLEHQGAGQASHPVDVSPAGMERRGSIATPHDILRVV